MDSLNSSLESNDSSEKGFSKDELIEIFETNEEVLSNGLSALVLKLKIAEYDDVFILLRTIADQMRVTETMVESYLAEHYGEDMEEEEDDFDLPNRLN